MSLPFETSVTATITFHEALSAVSWIVNNRDWEYFCERDARELESCAKIIREKLERERARISVLPSTGSTESD